MRIGLIIYGSLDTVSGGYLYDRKLVAHLRDQGDTVEIISQPPGSYGYHLGQNVSPSLHRRLAQASFDVLLQDELNHPSLFLLNRRLKRRVDYPLVSIVHHLRVSEQHNPPLRPFYRYVERRYLRTVDGFIFNSPTTLAAVRDLRGGLPPHVTAPPAGDRFTQLPDEQTIGARAVAAGPLRVLFVGNVIARKGLHTLLAALARLPRETWQLTIVGDAGVDRAYRQTLERQLTGVPRDRVTWLGKVSDDVLARELAAHDVLAVPSGYEGFGIVYLEGMAFGLPAIGTTAGAAAGLIVDGENGFLIPPEDVELLARRLRALQEDRARLARMSRAARRRYDAHPAWEESMARARDFLLSLC